MFFIVIGFFLALIAHYKIIRIQVACYKMFEAIEDRFQKVETQKVKHLSGDSINETLTQYYTMTASELDSLYNKLDLHVKDQDALWNACFADKIETRALFMQKCLTQESGFFIQKAVRSLLQRKKIPQTSPTVPTESKGPTVLPIESKGPTDTIPTESPIDSKDLIESTVPKESTDPLGQKTADTSVEPVDKSAKTVKKTKKKKSSDSELHIE